MGGSDQLKYTLEDWPGLAKSTVLGLQHILMMFSAMILAPILIIATMGGNQDQLLYMLTAVMVASGIATLIQSLGIGPVGARLPIIMGTEAFFVGPLAMIGLTSGFNSIFVAVMLGGLFVILISLFVKKLIKYFPPLVTGTVITCIGLYLIPIGINVSLGQGTPLFGKPETFIVALITIVVIILTNRLLKGFAQTSSLLLAIIIGTVIASFFGMVDMTPIATASWFSLPHPFKYGFAMPGVGTILVIFLCYLVTTMETIGQTIAYGEVAQTEVTGSRLRSSVAADGIGSFISGLLGGTPLTTYAQNIAVVPLTKVASRFVAAVAGGILIVLGLFPKFAALVTIIPAPVLGAAILIMFAMVAGVGVGQLRTAIRSDRDMLIFAISIALALGFSVAPAESLSFLPMSLNIFFKTGVAVGALSAVVLNILIPEPKENAQ